MSMTRAERKVLEEAQRRASLHLPAYDKPAPLSLELIKDLVETYELGTGSVLKEITQHGRPKRVMIGWKAIPARGAHGAIQYITDGNTQGELSGNRLNQQGVGDFYASRLQALKVVRWEVTEQLMHQLRAIDEEIEKEMGK